MIDDNLQFALSQYADGTLTQTQRGAVEQLLVHDAEARQTVAEYRRLNMLLAASVRPLPNVDWLRLTQQISAAIDRSHSIPGTAAIGAEQAASEAYSMAWGRGPLTWAIAASLVIASSLVWISLQESSKVTATLAIAPPAIPANIEPIQRAQVADVRVLQVDIASGPAVIHISVGPSAAIEQSSLWLLYPEVVQRPTSISIAGGPGQIQRDEPYAAQ